MATATELEASEGEPALALGFVGSAENDFTDAGRLHRLGGARHVLFTRGGGEGIEVHETPQGLRVEIPLPYVSARHAELTLGSSWNDREHRLRDHDSRNGTHVEGRPARGDVAVRPGEIIEIGRSFWTLVELSARDDEDEIAALEPEGSINPRMRHLLGVLARLAPSGVPLLITGETGVGKDRIAQAVHRASGCAGEFVHANVVSTAAEQRMYGTAADPGLMARARDGTLYVDEVGELDLSAQTRLLAALVAHAPSLSQQRRPEEVRLIAASTRDVRGMVAVEAFRADLLARLAGFEAHLPPLRERREDLGVLTRALVKGADGSPVRMATAVFRSMLAYKWPFNVRELQHALAAAVALAARSTEGITLAVWRSVCTASDADARDPARIQAVREALVRHLVTHRGDTLAVAQSMHCEVHDVQRWLERLHIDPLQFGRAG